MPRASMSKWHKIKETQALSVTAVLLQGHIQHCSARLYAKKDFWNEIFPCFPTHVLSYQAKSLAAFTSC